MRRILCGLGVLALAVAAEAADRPNLTRLRADLEFLAADALQGRVSLEPGADVAARFIAAEFQKAGLKPAAGQSYLEEFRVIAYSPDRTTTLVVERGGRRETFPYGADFRASTPREIVVRAPVVFAGYGITAPEYGYDDYAGLDVKGKIVLVFDHEPQERDPQSVFNGTGHTRHGARWVKALNAGRRGAAALLMASEPLRKHPGLFDPTPGTGAGSLRLSAPTQALDDAGPRIPTFTVNTSLAEKLLDGAGGALAQLQARIDETGKPASRALDGTVVEIRSANSRFRRAVSSNVAGLLEGSDPALRQETVLITAHYDHLGASAGRTYPGANDNASGTVRVIELARLFAAAPRPKRSLLFLVFGSEEEGLLGSYYYIERPLRPLETTRAVINLDMIGRDEAHIPQSEGALEIAADTSNEMNLVGAFYSPDLRRIIEEQNGAVGLRLNDKFDRDHVLNALFRCDHFPFLLRDVPTIWLFGGWHPGYHEPSDTVDKINLVKLEKTVRLAQLAARAVADGDTVPRFQAGSR